MAHTITDRLLEDYLKCHSKAYLRVHGRAGEASEYLALCSLLDARHHADASLWLSTQTAAGGVSHFGGSLLPGVSRLRLHGRHPQEPLGIVADRTQTTPS